MMKFIEVLREITNEPSLDIKTYIVDNPDMISMPLHETGHYLCISKNTNYRLTYHIKYLSELYLNCKLKNDEIRKYIDIVRNELKEILEYSHAYAFSEYRMNMSFSFLEERMRYAIVIDRKVVHNNSLDEASIKTSVMKLEKNDEFGIAVRNGELFGFSSNHLKIIVMSETMVDNLIKSVIKLRLIYLNKLYENMIYLKELEKINAGLESEVKLRTEEITEKNKLLEIEKIRLTSALNELEEKNTELKIINEDKNRLMGLIAHDIRNPLWLIKGYSDLLLDSMSGKENEDEYQFLKEIDAASEFAMELMGDILSLSSISSGNIELKKARTNISEFVLGSVKSNNMLAEKKRIDIITEIKNENMWADIDNIKMHEVMNNLISNAVKYSFPGSIIRIVVEDRDKNIVIRVIDCGQGIPENEIDKIFEPFYRSKVMTTGGESSSGLGLNIVKKIIEKHGGQVGVKSHTGVGTEFTVVFPGIEV